MSTADPTKDMCNSDVLNAASNYMQIFACIDPFAVAYVAVAASLGFSIIGAGWGIYMSGASIVGNGVKMPRIQSRNFISVIFCEATAVYGIILSIILSSKIGNNTDWSTSSLQTAQKCAYSLLGAGLSCGLSNVVSGMAIGSIGAGAAIADA